MKLGMGAAISQMKKQIAQLRAELDELGESEKMPEMIETTNLLRANEHLTKTDKKKSELLEAYAEYTANLERLLKSVLEIQEELKEILREQSGLITKSKKTAKKAPRKKPAKRARR